MLISTYDYSFRKFLKTKRQSKEQIALDSKYFEIHTYRISEISHRIQGCHVGRPKIVIQNLLPTNHLSHRCCNQPNTKTAG